ncbi:MAG: tetratricopeptide repeat protein [Aestuariivirga sp.]
MFAKSSISAFALTLTLLAQPATAGQLEDGVSAVDQHEYVTAIKLLRPLAEAGNPKAEVYLGAAYTYYNKDFAEALKWYRKAADQGYSDGMLNVGVVYSLGEGVPHDDAIAVEWYRRAAELGNSGGQSELGFAYKDGVGVAQDFVQAYMWYNVAATQYSIYGEIREDLSKKMTAQQIAKAQELSRNWLTAHPKN